MISLDKNEHVILEVRKHWFILFGEIALSILLLLAPAIILPIFEQIGLRIDLESISLIFFLYGLWAICLWVVIFIFWTNYYLDVWVITNLKIFDIEQHGLFKREVSVVHYEKVQDITFEMNGLIAAFMNFGDIHVQTAAAEKQFTIRGVKDPAYVQRKLNEVLIKRQGETKF